MLSSKRAKTLTFWLCPTAATAWAAVTAGGECRISSCATCSALSRRIETRKNSHQQVGDGAQKQFEELEELETSQPIHCRCRARDICFERWFRPAQQRWNGAPAGPRAARIFFRDGQPTRPRSSPHILQEIHRRE